MRPKGSFPPGFADQQLSLARGLPYSNPLRVIAEASGAGSIGPKMPAPKRAVAVDELLLCSSHHDRCHKLRPDPLAVKAADTGYVLLSAPANRLSL